MLDKFKYIVRPSDFKKVILIFIGMLVTGLLEVLSVSSILPFMAVVTNPELIQENKYLYFVYSYFEFDSYSHFLTWTGMLVIIFLTVSNSYNAFMNWAITVFVNSVSCNLEAHLLKGYLNSSYSFFLNRNASHLSKNILSEVERSIKGVFLPVLNIITKSIVSIFLLTMLFFVDPVMVLVIFTVLGGSYLLVYKLVRNTLRRNGVNSTKTMLERYQITNEAIYGIKNIKLKGVESVYVDKYIRSSLSFYQNNSISSLISILPRYLLEVVTFGGIILLVIYLIGTGQNSKEIMPLLALYALSGYRLMPALQQIYGQLTQVKYNMPALNILVDDLKELSNETVFIDKDKAVCKIPFTNLIEIKSISYSYPNVKTPVLDSLDLKIVKNTTIGLVGMSGSGKTTLVDILLGLLDIDSGEYVVDGINIDKNNITEWQKIFDYVPQSIYLTDDSIECNIAFSVPRNDIDHSKLMKAIKLAKLDDFIRSLPDGIKSFVGDRGVRLSGGQRQRIGVARALYFDPEILVLDEATSALDSATESVIMDAVHSLSHKKTIIIIAHRLETIKECDVIHVLDKGKIVDSGTYVELVATSEKFREISRK